MAFIRRFLIHVLPFQYKRVRHFGLYASAKRSVLEALRGQFGTQAVAAPKLKLADWLAGLGIEAPLRCPFCGQGQMRLGREFAPIRGVALWLLILLGLPVAGRLATAPAS